MGVHKLSVVSGVWLMMVLQLPEGRIRIDALSKALYHQTGIVLAFNSGKIAAGSSIMISHPQPTVKEVLTDMRAQLHVHLRLYRDHVILTPIPIRPIVRKPEKRSAHRSDTAHSLKEDTTSLSEISLLVASARLSDTVRLRLPGKQPILSQQRGSTGQRNVRMGQRSGSNGVALFAQLGLTVDEIFYASPMIQVGAKQVFALFSWNTNFKKREYRYGLGTSFQLTQRWSAGLDITGGSMSADYSAYFGITRDSTVEVGVKNNLYRLHISITRSLNKHLQCQLGPALNWLRTDYTYSNARNAQSMLSLDHINADQAFSVIQPPYLIYNNYNPNAPSNNKLWIGVQLRLFYSFGVNHKE
jgi:hypothetical protein